MLYSCYCTHDEKYPLKTSSFIGMVQLSSIYWCICTALLCTPLIPLTPLCWQFRCTSICILITQFDTIFSVHVCNLFWNSTFNMPFTVQSTVRTEWTSRWQHPSLDICEKYPNKEALSSAFKDLLQLILLLQLIIVIRF